MRPLATLALGLGSLVLLAACQPKGQQPPKRVYDKLATKDVKVGSGPEVEEGDTVFIQYSSYLADGMKRFDHNITNPRNKNPMVFRIGTQDNIKGASDGIIGMQVGGEREIQIPAELAYGSVFVGSIPPNSDIFMEVKLLYLIKKGEEDSFGSEDLKVGSGPEAKVGDTVAVHYVGKYLDGTVFDDTRKRGETVTFKIGANQAISGVDVGVRGMRVGGQRRLELPPDVAWGPLGSGKVAPGQVLTYDIELVSVRSGG
jgi:FKBP-type peptidyl-prolyl cis-trans isomerase